MKKLFFFLAFIILISLPLVASVQTEINPEYKKGETIIAKVSGNFLENIQKSDIHFYRRHMVTSLSPYDVLKIQGEFYITAKIGEEKIPDNYSIVVEDVLHMEGSQSTREDIILEFIILDEIADFSIWPGAVYSYDDFYIEVQNLQYSSLEIIINDSSEEGSSGSSFLEWLFGGGIESSSNQGATSIILLSGEIENIEFELGNSTAFANLKLSSTNQEYNIPTYLVYIPPEGANESEENGTIIEEEIIEEGEIGGGNESEENGTIIEEEIIEEGENEEEIELLNEEEIEELEATPVFEERGILRTCSELRGHVCNTNEECNGTEKNAKDIFCCLGECIEKEEEKSNNKIVGWVLIGIVAIVIFYFIRMKSKKTKKAVDLTKRIRR